MNGVSIERSVLSGEFIGANVFTESKDTLILSGIDGFKIVTKKLHQSKTLHTHITKINNMLWLQSNLQKGSQNES